MKSSKLVLSLLVAALLLHVVTMLKISAFNIKTFGDSKMSNQTIADIIVSVSAGGKEQLWLLSGLCDAASLGQLNTSFLQASVHLCVHLCTHPPVNPPVHIPRPSICVSIHLSTHPSVHPSTNASNHTCLHPYHPSIHPSIRASIHSPICSFPAIISNLGPFSLLLVPNQGGVMLLRFLTLSSL